MARPREDWAAVLERLLEGDRGALLKLTRLINSFLGRWNAYDFREEWDDLIQEVVLAGATALREGKLRDRDAAFGYLRSTARFKFTDRLRKHLRCSEDEQLSWEEVVDGPSEPTLDPALGESRHEVRRALEALPANKRDAVVAVYLHGKTYDEASEDTGIPLGSLKRYLREGLAELRESLAILLEEA